MDKRLELQAILEEILGSRNVYFQPPASVKMKYPAIVYKRKSINAVHANDSIYRQLPEYELILIDPNPDSEFVEKILHLPFCRYDRHYVADNLNHDVFSVHY
jgi:hypothetical protein